MKTSLKVIFSALALGVLASPSFLRAQDDKAPPAEAPKGGDKGGKGGRGGRGGMMNADAMTDRVDKAVTLTAEQKPKVHDIYAKMITDMQGLAREDMRTKGMEIRNATNKDIRALLTEDQAKKFDEMVAQTEANMRGKGGRKKAN